jgi:hypothetical protein
MRLRLYDEQLNQIAIIGGNFVSVMWSEGYNTVEPFSLELRATDAVKKKVRPECYVGRDDRKTLAVIKTVDIRDGKIIATGKQAARCLADVSFVGTVERGAQVAEGIHGAWEASDKYEGFIFEGNGPEAVYDHQISNKSILELSEIMCRDTDVGFRAVRSDRKVKVEFYKPEEDPNLKYSEALGNLTVENITLSTENLKNHAIILGAGEGEDRARAEIDNSGGGKKLSMIVDARDIAREETDTDGSYREKLLERGNEKLLEKTKTWECVFRPIASDFGKRFELGDILTVILAEYGLKLKARVARFTQIEQNNQTKTTIEVGTITIVR